MSSSPAAGLDVDFGQLPPVAPPEPAPSLEQASRKARRLVAAAEAEADRVREEARAAGHAEGFDAGRSAALMELKPSVEAAVQALSAVRALEADACERVERAAVEPALHVGARGVAGASGGS